MEAKDTVMSDQEMMDLGRGEPRAVADHAIANRQAEISFKAGIKEVVDYLELIKTIGLEGDGYVSHTFVAEKKEWKAKLKDWEL